MYSSMTWRPSVRAQAESELRRPPVASASRAQGPRIGSAQGSSPDFFSTCSILFSPFSPRFLPVFSPFSPRFPVVFVFSEGKVGKSELDLVIDVVSRNSVLLFSHLIPSWCFIFVSDRAFKSCLFKSYSLAWKWRGRSAVQAARLILIMLVYSDYVGLCWSRCLPFVFLMVTHVPVSQASPGHHGDILGWNQAPLREEFFFETQRWVNIESTLSRHRSRRAPQDADTSLRVQVACRGVPQHKSGIVGRDKCDKCDKETCQNHLDLCSFGLIWSENQIRPDAFPWHKFFTASMLLHAFLSSSSAMRGFNLFFLFDGCTGSVPGQSFLQWPAESQDPDSDITSGTQWFIWLVYVGLML